MGSYWQMVDSIVHFETIKKHCGKLRFQTERQFVEIFVSFDEGFFFFNKNLKLLY